MKITGVIRTVHENPACIAASVAADNLKEMDTQAIGSDGIQVVETRISGTKIRSIIASVDDYLANITVSEELCKKDSGQKRSEH
ncbi:MAG: hypothetical protein LUQ50_14335 [Methanospirillum sp.]|uniref:KEOPS complex subunit Pcc1 n=1 Tax=Methanospirillum sp. TaxID=45200 RepID=UPI00237342CF|nr:KEOPS complex subunit Pcc1 [Methanospirillum sp.]MDD1730233.1 hypothetical protein [Methanospirillum sp.]